MTTLATNGMHDPTSGQTRPDVPRADVVSGASVPRWQRLLSLTRNPRLLSLTDQALVSGTNFLSTVLVGRFCSQHELGLYSLAFSWLVVLVCLQEASLMIPFTVLGARLDSQGRKELAGTVLIHHWMLCLLILTVLVGIALVLWSTQQSSSLPGLLAVLACVVPFALLRDLHRRLAFAQVDVQRAVLIDVSILVLQIGLLLVVTGMGHLSAITAQLAIGTACALVGLLTLWLTRKHFVFHIEQVLPTLKRHWHFARWIVASQTVGVVHGFVVYWLLALILSTAATGAFAACMTLVLLTNPLLLGMGNYLGPRAARAFAKEGPTGVRRAVLPTLIVVVGLMALFACGMGVLGGEVLTLIYGQKYAAFGSVVTTLAIGMTVGSIGMMTDHGLRALEKTAIAFRASSCGLIVSVIASWTLATHWGISGAAWGFVMGITTSSLMRGWAFLHAVREREDPR